MIQGFMRLSIIGPLFCLLLMMSSAAYAQDTIKVEAHRPKVALVLSGGGAKGFVHIGVLKVLEEEGIPIDMIVGTSIGSLVGGIYALGYNASEIEAMTKALDWEKILSDKVPRQFLSKDAQLLKQRYAFSIPLSEKKILSLPQGLIKGQNVLNLFCGIAGNVPMNADFSKLPISYACIATNLETGQEEILRNGFLPTAMFSSMAIPIFFQPSDRNGLLLIDGGLANNFPTNVAKEMGADIIIGVDIRNDYYSKENLQSISNIVGQLVNFFDQTKNSSNDSICDLIIRPDVSGFTMSSFNNQAVDTLVKHGEKATNDLREQLRELKAKYRLEPNLLSRAFVKPDRWHITNLTFACKEHIDEEFMRKTLNMKIPGDFSSDEITEAIDRLYGLGGFEKIYYNLVDTEKGKTLNLNITTKKVFAQNVGLKANTTDAAAIMFNMTQKNYGKIFGHLSASAELSANPGLSLLAESDKTKYPTFGNSLKVKYQNYDIYEKGNLFYKANVFYSSGTIYSYLPFHRRFNLGLGLQEEYYHGNIFASENNLSIASGNTDFFMTSAYSYLSFDNWDDYYFPKRGTNMYTELSLNVEPKKNWKITPALLLKMNNVTPISQNVALLFNLYGRALLQTDFPRLKKTMVGGEPYSQYFNYYLPFVGLPAVSMADRFAYIGLLGFRVHVSDNQYLSALFNSLLQSPDMKKRENFKTIFGGGIKYSRKTPIGPLDITLGYSDSVEKPCFSANFGYWF